MKKVKKGAKKESTGKVAGLFIKGSTVANLYEALEDGKNHTKSSLKGCLETKTVDLGNRLRELNRKGVKSKQFSLVITEDHVKLVEGKVKAPKESPREEKEERREKKSKKGGTSKKSNRVEDVPVADED